MPQRQRKMPTKEMWFRIENFFWHIKTKLGVEKSEKIHVIKDWEDPKHQKEKLKVWKALVVWSDNKTKFSNNSQ